MSVELVAVLAALAAMLLSVLLHLAVLELLVFLLRTRVRAFFSLMFSVPVLMISHVLQVAIFGGFLLVLFLGYGEQIGKLSGGFTPDALSVWYFSASVFTTVGFGDITATGPIRLFVGLEAIAGLVLITWSASFTFLGMQTSWASRFAPQKDVPVSKPTPGDGR